MKALILVLVFLVTPMLAVADPFLTCDPQDGVEEHLLVCGDYSVTVVANEDGSMLWDFAYWHGPYGCFDCTVRARVSYGVEDVATGVITTHAIDSDPADVRIKIPKVGSNSGYQIK